MEYVFSVISFSIALVSIGIGGHLLGSNFLHGGYNAYTFKTGWAWPLIYGCLGFIAVVGVVYFTQLIDLQDLWLALLAFFIPYIVVLLILLWLCFN